MTSLRTSRRPNYLSKRRNHQSYINVEDEGEKKCLEIVGRKIPLYKRRGRATSYRFDTEAISSEFTLCDIEHCIDADFDLEREPLAVDEDDLQTKDKLQCKNSDDTTDENSNTLLDNTRVYTISPIESKSFEDIKTKNFFKKRSPHITISLPTIQKNKQDDAEEEFDDSDLFKEKMYMVCHRSPSCSSSWKTTCVTFPNETWKLEKRRLSHRHSSVSSSLSLSLTRLDLACKTPDTSLMSTPIDGSNFVFPHL